MKQIHMIIGLLALFLVLSCENEPFTLTVGEEFVNASTKMLRIDTLDMILSTHKKDSVITSGRGGILAGIYLDEEMGLISAKSYFSFGLPTYYQIGEDEIYDSITLILAYNDYSYGDTTQIQEFSIHTLTEDLDHDTDDDLYSTSTTAYEATPCGNIRFQPRPLKQDTLEVTLDAELGRSMFDYLNGDLSEDASTSDFLEYFKGMVLMSNGTSGNAILGFLANDSALYLKIHTHEVAQQTIENVYILPFAQQYLQYNQIECDWSANPKIGALDAESMLSSAEMSGVSYVQSGLGLYTKITFPGLQAMTEFKSSILTSAILYLEPENMTHWDSETAAELRLYYCNYFGDMESTLVNEAGTELTAIFNRDAMYDEKNYFAFDVTDYIGVEMADLYVHPEFGFFVGMSGTSESMTLDRIVLGADQSEFKNVKLELTFFQYDQ